MGYILWKYAPNQGMARIPEALSPFSFQLDRTIMDWWSVGYLVCNVGYFVPSPIYLGISDWVISYRSCFLGKSGASCLQPEIWRFFKVSQIQNSTRTKSENDAEGSSYNYSCVLGCPRVALLSLPSKASRLDLHTVCHWDIVKDPAGGFSRSWFTCHGFVHLGTTDVHLLGNNVFPSPIYFGDLVIIMACNANNRFNHPFSTGLHLTFTLKSSWICLPQAMSRAALSRTWWNWMGVVFIVSSGWFIDWMVLKSRVRWHSVFVRPESEGHRLRRSRAQSDSSTIYYLLNAVVDVHPRQNA